MRLLLVKVTDGYTVIEQRMKNINPHPVEQFWMGAGANTLVWLSQTVILLIQNCPGLAWPSLVIQWLAHVPQACRLKSPWGNRYFFPTSPLCRFSRL